MDPQSRPALPAALAACLCRCVGSIRGRAVDVRGDARVYGVGQDGRVSNAQAVALCSGVQSRLLVSVFFIHTKRFFYVDWSGSPSTAI